MSALRSTASAVKGRLKKRATAVGSVVRLQTSAPEVVITFDDGPEPGGTERVLEALARRCATATFFVLLTRARRHRALLDQVVAAGHDIGLHGVDHRPLTQLPIAEVRRRQWEGRAELEDLTGRNIEWMRPPYGRQTLRTWQATRSAGLVPTFWGPTTWDWRDITQQERVDAALKDLRAGAILLAHDGFAGPMDGVDDGPTPVVDRGDLIGKVLDGLAGRGLVGRSLSDAVASGTPVLEARFQR